MHQHPDDQVQWHPRPGLLPRPQQHRVLRHRLGRLQRRRRVRPLRGNGRLLVRPLLSWCAAVFPPELRFDILTLRLLSRPRQCPVLPCDVRFSESDLSFFPRTLISLQTSASAAASASQERAGDCQLCQQPVELRRSAVLQPRGDGHIPGKSFDFSARFFPFDRHYSAWL